nr:type II secretion system F family protein [Streptomyces sp. YIM 130001]
MGAEVVHRLGVGLLIGAALVGMVSVVWAVVVGRRVREVRARVRAVGEEVPESSRAEASPGSRVASAVQPVSWSGERSGRWSSGAGWVSVVGVACAGYAVWGGVVGGLIGLTVGYAVRHRRRRGAAAGEVETAEAERQLPLAADLLAACVAAGAGPAVAAESVGRSLPGPVGRCLARVAAELRLGGEPAEAWRRLAAIPGPGAGPLARCLERADASGAPAADQVAGLAAECRSAWARAATARARRAAVLMAAPVGLCFLPAFLVVGIAPVLVGMAGRILNGG